MTTPTHQKALRDGNEDRLDEPNADFDALCTLATLAARGIRIGVRECGTRTYVETGKLCGISPAELQPRPIELACTIRSGLAPPTVSAGEVWGRPVSELYHWPGEVIVWLGWPHAKADEACCAVTVSRACYAKLHEAGVPVIVGGELANILADVAARRMRPAAFRRLVRGKPAARYDASPHIGEDYHGVAWKAVTWGRLAFECNMRLLAATVRG